jgi:hypothetical protein
MNKLDILNLGAVICPRMPSKEDENTNLGRSWTENSVFYAD